MEARSVALVSGAVVAGAALGAWLERRRNGARRTRLPHRLASARFGGAYRLRPATRADCATIVRLVIELAVFEKCPDAVRIDAEQMGRDFDAGRFECLLVVPADAPYDAVGFAVFFETYSTWEGRCLYLEDLYIAQDARGRGLGTAMLRALAALAHDRGCARFQWQALDWNMKAVEFYKSARIGASRHPHRQRARAAGTTSDQIIAAYTGASERIGDDGTRWLNFIMERDAIRDLAHSSAA